MYYFCEEYYKPITVQCYMAYCVSWIHRVTLDLQTNWIYECAFHVELAYEADLLNFKILQGVHVSPLQWV